MSGLGGVGNAGVFLTGMGSIRASCTGPRWRRTCLLFVLSAPHTRVVDLTPVVRIRFAVCRVAVCRVAVRSIHC